MGGLFSEPKPVLQTAVQAAVTPAVTPTPAATLVTEPQKEKKVTQRKSGGRAASILTTNIEDSKLGG